MAMPGTPTTLPPRMIGTHAPALNRLITGARARRQSSAAVLRRSSSPGSSAVAGARGTTWSRSCSPSSGTRSSSADSGRHALLGDEDRRTRSTARIAREPRVRRQPCRRRRRACTERTSDSGAAPAVCSSRSALLTVVLSWTLVNTVFTSALRTSYYTEPHGGVDFGDDRGPPDYRDFAYLAFTVGHVLPGVGHDAVDEAHAAHCAAPGHHRVHLRRRDRRDRRSTSSPGSCESVAGHRPPPHNDRICQTWIASGQRLCLQALVLGVIDDALRLQSRPASRARPPGSPWPRSARTDAWRCLAPAPPPPRAPASCARGR